MKKALLKYLVSPKKGEPLSLQNEKCKGDDIVSDTLVSKSGNRFPIRDGIPRFVDSHYANNFSFEWHKHRRTQFDRSGMNLSEEQFFRYTNWTPSEINGKLILDAGCGSGRFSEIALKYGAIVIAFDLSEAVNDAWENLSHYNNFSVLQADICELPFLPETFDYVYCIGVLQHTPNPIKSLQCLLKLAKKDGKFACWFYVKNWRKPWTWLHMKWFLRPFLKHLPAKMLYRFVKWYVPKLMPLSRAVRSIDIMNRMGWHEMLVPIANRDYIAGTSEKDKLDLAILDTFDWYSPKYDKPLSEEKVMKILASIGYENITRSFVGAIQGTRK